MCGCDGVFCDCMESWIVGFSRDLGATPVISSKLWGIYTTLLSVVERDLNRVWIECYSSLVVQLVMRDCIGSHPYASLTKSIRMLLQRSWTIIITHSLQEENRVPDWLWRFFLHDLASASVPHSVVV